MNWHYWLAHSFCWQNQNHFDLNFSIVANLRAWALVQRSWAKCELGFNYLFKYEHNSMNTSNIAWIKNGYLFLHLLTLQRLLTNFITNTNYKLLNKLQNFILTSNWSVATCILCFLNTVFSSLIKLVQLIYLLILAMKFMKT